MYILKYLPPIFDHFISRLRTT